MTGQKLNKKFVIFVQHFFFNWENFSELSNVLEKLLNIEQNFPAFCHTFFTWEFLD